MRRIDELKVHGAAGRVGLTWSRFHNTVKRDGEYVFGVGGSWRHSFQFDLVELPVVGTARPSLQFIYPSGVRRIMEPGTSGFWTADAGLPERAWIQGGGIMVELMDGTRAFFVRFNSPSRGGVFYEVQSLTDLGGLVTKLYYDNRGYLARVVEPAGRQLTIAYRPVAHQRGVQRPLVKIAQAPARGQWLEFSVPANLSSVDFDHLRLYGRRGGPAIGVAELQFFAPGSAVAIRGTPSGTGTAPAAAFDGDSSSVFQGNRTSVNVCALELGSDSRSKVARIRVLAAPGKESTLVGATIEGMTRTPATRLVIAEVKGSDGRPVSYDYEVIADPVVRNQFVTLKTARYADGTLARYTYEWPSAVSRPLLAEANDARYVGHAKHIRYTYHDEPGMIHQEINPLTGGVLARLEVDAQDPRKRIVHYSDQKQETFTYDDAKTRLLEKTDSLGRKTRYEYAHPGAGPATARVDHQGHRTEWTKNERGHVTATNHKGKPHGGVAIDARTNAVKQTDRHGREHTTVTAVAQGKVKHVQHHDGATEQTTYDKLGRATQHKGRDGIVLTVARDARGRRSSVTDTRGRSLAYGYDALDRISTITDSVGRTARYERNDRDEVVRTIFPDGRTVSFTYDYYGRQTARTDQLGRTATRSYDVLGRVTRQQDHAGRVTTFDYADLPQGCSSCSLGGSPSTIIHPDGTMTKMLYDTAGRLLARTSSAGTTASATTTYSYDTDGNVTSATDPLGRVTRYTYDEENHRLSMTDPLGRVTKWTYDDRSNVLTTTFPNGSSSRTTYDSSDRVLSSTDAAGNTTRYAYDISGNVTQITDARSKVTRHTYEGRRRTATTFPDDKRQTWDYDAVGRIVRAVSPDGLETRTTYDVGSRPLSIVDSAGRSFTYTYDALGRRTTASDTFGRVSTWTYDARGNVTRAARPDGAATGSTYDAQDRLVAVTDPAGNTVRYTYDAAGNQTSLTDARGHIYRFAYDALRRRTAMIYPDGSQEKWTFDVAGQLTGYSTRAGQAKATAYNAVGQPLADTWSPAGAAPNVAYSYDSAGRLAAVDNGYAKLTYTHDAAGRLTSETSNLAALVPGLDPHTVRYDYDELGRRDSLTYPDRTKISYGYDARGRLATVSDGPGRTLARYDYDAMGRIEKLTRDNGVATGYAYNMAAQLTDIRHTKANEVLASSRYTLDALGRRTAQTREDGITEVYTYDLTSQVIGVDYGTTAPTRRESFSYDVVGNRLSATDATSSGAAKQTAYTANTLNQYTETRTSGVSTTLSYDANGNLVNDGRQRYRYDAQNRLVAVESTVAHMAGATKAEFSYDARNRCVLRRYFTADSQGLWQPNAADSRALTYDTAWNLLTERSLDQQQAGKYVHGLRTDEIVRAELRKPGTSDVETHYPLADGLGSAVALADRQGRVTERFRYDVFGSPSYRTPDYQVRTNSVAGYRILFTGREWLGGVALNDHRNRYFSPGFGRWPTTDPIGFAGGNNLFAYVGNAPANYTDPYGLLRDCDAEHTACFQICINGPAPWPCKKGSGAHGAICASMCLAEYMACKAANGVETALVYVSDAAQWLADNPEVVVGTIVVAGGVAFVVATGGSGGLILVAVVAATAGGG